MKLLEDRILKDGQVLPGGILKVDGFLNHRIDPQLFYDMAEELKRRFRDEGVNKILTIEASGISLAIMDVWSVEVESFTHGNTNTVMVSKEYLGPEDRVLIVDDFLATGAALRGLKELVEMAGGSVAGAGIAIEKVFQGGGDLLRKEGMRVESLARIASMTDDSITFC